MTLEQATSAALEAAQTGDLDALERAIEARQVALDLGESNITAGVLSAGEFTVQLLQELILNTRMEASRLRRIADGFRPDAIAASHVDLVG
jgi:hypothetical protein